MIWLAAIAAFALGYTARHYRPLRRIDIWAWDQVDRRNRDLRNGPARRRPGWYAANAVFVAELVVSFTLAPRETAEHIRGTWARHRQEREANL